MGATGYIIKGHNGGRGGEARKEVVVSAADGTIDVEKVETFDKVDFRIKTTYDGYETISVGSPASGGYFKAAHIKFNEKNRRYRLVCILNGGSYTPVAKDFAIYYIKFGWRTGGENEDHWYIEEYSRQGNGAYVSLEQIALNEYNVLIHTPTGYAYANIGILKEDKEPDVTIDHFNNNTTRYTPTGTIIETETPAWKNGALVDTNPEDLEIRNGLLQLADRSSINGLGYIILRPDKTFAEQVTQSNCIYEIRYVFAVGGTEANPVIIPENCVLKFEGGKLTNGVISSNKLKIEGILGCFNEVVFSNSTTFTSDINLAWFVKNDGSQEVSGIANNIIKIASLSMVRVKVKSGIYNIANPILLYHNTYIEGSVSSDRQGAKFVWVGDKYTPFVGKQTNQYDMFAYNDYGNSSRAEMVCIKNLFIDGNSKARVGINVSHIVYSSFEYIFIRNTTMAYVYGHSSINGSFTTPCIYNKFENIFGWSTKLTDAETQYVCRFGFRLQSQVNACTFISCRAGNCDTGFALEDNIDVDGETFNSTLNWHSNQNQFISCASEGEVVGLYINSEYNTFIGHRFEGVRDFDLYFPELEGSDNRQQHNIFICPTVFGGSSVPNNEPYNVLKPNNVYLGCSWWNEDHTRFEMSKFKNVYSDILDTNKIYGTNAFLSSAEIDNIVSKHITANNFIQLRGQGQSKTLAKFSCNWITDGERFRLQTISPEGTTHTLLNSSTATDSVFDFVSPIKMVNYNQVSDIPLTINGGNNAQNIIFMFNGNIAWKTNNIVYTPIYKPVDNNSYGTTAQRPTTNIEIGFQYFDTDLGKPIYWTGAKWVDANGNDLQ